MSETNIEEGINLFVKFLSKGHIKSRDALNTKKTKVRIEDNVGEAIHIHYGTTRIEMTVEEFLIFAEALRTAVEDEYE